MGSSCHGPGSEDEVISIVSTKIELSHNKIARTRDLDELAAILFPGNKNQQRIFLAIFIELKYAEHEFLGTLQPLCDKYDFSPRMLETVRSKMRRMGLIDHVSRFNQRHGYREGWVFSSRFGKSLEQLADIAVSARERKGAMQEQKDRGLFRLL